MGLFIKASELLNRQPLAFSSFITKYDIDTFAIFKLNDNYYSIINSYGFDGESIATSVSTKDFWNGICCEENTVYNFTCYNKNLNPILQFFSIDMKDVINTVSLYKSDNFIYMLCNMDITCDIREDLNKINLTANEINTKLIDQKFVNEDFLFKYEINFDEAIDNFILTLKDYSNDKALLKYSLYNELANRFSCKIAKNSTKKTGNNSIRILYSFDKIAEDNYLLSLINLLKHVLNESAELINFTNFGIAHSINDIKKFFQVD